MTAILYSLIYAIGAAVLLGIGYEACSVLKERRLQRRAAKHLPYRPLSQLPSDNSSN